LSSPLEPPKSLNFNKTNDKKVENNWHTSFGQFGKIEPEAKTEGPAVKSRVFTFNRNEAGLAKEPGLRI